MPRRPPSLADVVPLGVFEEQILVAVVRTADDAFGMEIRRELERITGRELAIGAVYATLDRLEEKGLLRSHRVRPDGATRRIFEISLLGVGALRETREMRERLWLGVDLRRFAAS